MIWRIVFSPRSRLDLEKIREWIVEEAQSEEVADRLVHTLLDACDALATFPERYAVYPRARAWRMMPVGNYLVFFRLQQNEVLVGHIRHAAQRPFRG
jgi:plasmid stabilization system protein ParE